MLKDANAFTTIAVKDLEEAKKFYGEVLGLQETKTDEGGGVYYGSGSSEIYIYVSQYAGTNKATYVGWEVDDIEKVVADLKEKGVNFEHYDDMEGVTREGDIHSMGSLKATWFKDPSGNILSLGNG